jgi:hypothetical protein
MLIEFAISVWIIGKSNNLQNPGFLGKKIVKTLGIKLYSKISIKQGKTRYMNNWSADKISRVFENKDNKIGKVIYFNLLANRELIR